MIDLLLTPKPPRKCFSTLYGKPTTEKRGLVHESLLVFLLRLRKSSDAQLKTLHIEPKLLKFIWSRKRWLPRSAPVYRSLSRMATWSSTSAAEQLTSRS